MTTLAARDIVEKLDGKEPKATFLEVTLEPGQADVPHRHAGPAFGYVLEGEFEWAIDDQPAKVLKAGETFYEPAGSLHRVAKNPAAKGKTRVLAVTCTRGRQGRTIPEARMDRGRNPSLHLESRRAVHEHPSAAKPDFDSRTQKHPEPKK